MPFHAFIDVRLPTADQRNLDILLERWPTISRIFKTLDAMPAFSKAAPPNQPDAA